MEGVKTEEEYEMRNEVMTKIVEALEDSGYWIGETVTEDLDVLLCKRGQSEVKVIIVETTGDSHH